jgi:hypothetical protein
MSRPFSGARQSGLTLLELLVASLLTAMLLLALVQLVTAAGSATLLQDNQAALQDRIRYAGSLLTNTIGQAGYAPEPWKTDSRIAAIAPGTADHIDARSDRLAVQDWSDLNCFENRNPDLDESGQPRFYLRESVFDLNSSGHLTRTCRYGPSRSELVTQVRRQGLVPGIESFQLLFGDDSDADGNVDRWVRAGEWSDRNAVLGVRTGLLAAGPDSVVEPVSASFTILDMPTRTRTDGKLRETVELTMALRGHGG